ncbi:MAG: caspase family protein [Planctomycetota bacterium]
MARSGQGRRGTTGIGQLALLLCCIPFAGAAPHQEAAPPTSAAKVATGKAALVVGVDRYEQDGAAGRGLRNLHGCVNDAHRVRQLLMERFRFAADDILLLLDEEATHERIVQAFDEWLIRRAGPETEAVFWYSGHGSRAPDASGLEAFGMDSTLVAYDSRHPAHPGGVDIVDDELYSLLSTLCQRTTRVTVVTDCCHSGGSTRGPAAPSPRSVAPRTTPITFADVESIWPAGIPFVDDGDVARLQPLRYVHIAACAPDELADEHWITGPDGTEQAHGALTFFLLQGLEALPPHSSWERLVADVALRVAQSYGQRVQLEGEREREVFSADFAAPLPGFEALLGAAGEIMVRAGTFHMLREGSILRVQDLAGKALGQARIDRAGTVKSRASWLGEAPPVSGGARAVRAVETERPRGDPPLVVFVGPGDLEDALAAGLASAESPQVRVVREPTPDVEYQLFRPVPDQLQLWTCPDALPIWAASDLPDAGRLERLLSELLEKLAAEVRFKALMSLANEPGDLKVKVELVAPTEDELSRRKDQGSRGEQRQPAMITKRSTRGLACESEGALTVVCSGDAAVASVAKIRITLEPLRWPTSPYHVSVLCISETRERHVLYPSRGARDNLLAPGKSLEVFIRVYVDPRWREARAQRDRYLVVVTADEADLSPWQGESSLVDVVRPVTRGQHRLPFLLEDAWCGAGTRGGSLATLNPDWGIQALDVLVTKGP